MKYLLIAMLLFTISATAQTLPVGELDTTKRIWIRAIRHDSIPIAIAKQMWNAVIETTDCKHVYVAVEPLEIEAGPTIRLYTGEAKELICVFCHERTKQVVKNKDSLYRQYSNDRVYINPIGVWRLKQQP